MLQKTALAYADWSGDVLYLKKPGGKETVIATTADIPVSFTPQGDDPEQILTSPGDFMAVALSHDGTVAFSITNVFGSAVGLVAEGQVPRILEQLEGWINELVWAPGGGLLAAEVLIPSGKSDIFIYDITTGRRLCVLSEIMPEKELSLTRGCWLGDNRYFYFLASRRNEPYNLWRLDLQAGQVQPSQI
jgi:tricorn protease-like protein